MRTKTLITVVLFVSIMAMTQISFAADAAVKTMAEIMTHLNHFPSDADKEKLAAIINSSDSSAGEISVATAINDMQHKVSDADKAKLSAIVADKSSPADLSSLAAILLNTNHAPSASEIATLQKIATGS